MATTDELIEAFKFMTLEQFVDFRHRFEETFGVTGAEAVITLPSVEQVLPEVEEQTEFNVLLAAVGSKKIEVIKVVRELTHLGLREAKSLVDSLPPRVVLSRVPRAGAEAARDALVAAGAEVELT